MSVEDKGFGRQAWPVRSQNSGKKILDSTVGGAEIAPKQTNLFSVFLDQRTTQLESRILGLVAHGRKAESGELEIGVVDQLLVFVGAWGIAQTNSQGVLFSLNGYDFHRVYEWSK